LGDQLGPRDVGAGRHTGWGKVLVRPLARVAVGSTGTELVDPGWSSQRRPPDYDLNSDLLAAAPGGGADVFRVGPRPRRPEAWEAADLDQRSGPNLVVSTAGVSQALRRRQGR
jgi:molybdopterin biosynthesis enzyme